MNRSSYLSVFKKPQIFFTLDERYDKALADIYKWLTETFGSRQTIDWKNYTYAVRYDSKFDIGPEKPAKASEPTEKRCRISVFLGDHRYTFSMNIRKDGKNYLGGTLTSTKFVVGEDWTRGADLSDGDFSRATFDSIIRGILSVEFKRLETQGGRIQSRDEPRSALSEVEAMPGIPWPGYPDQAPPNDPPREDVIDPRIDNAQTYNGG